MSFFSPSYIEQLLTQYGSIMLFFAMCFGIIGLPIPDEILLVTAGVFAGAGKLSISAVLIAAAAGSASGITVTYILGRTVGYKVIKRYGKWIHVGTPELTRAHLWFERLGKWFLFIAYYIPGVRHVVGFVSGTTKMEFCIFALFVYPAALIFVSFFILIGYFFQGNWQKLTTLLTTCEHIWIGFIVLLAVSLVGYLIYRHYKK